MDYWIIMSAWIFLIVISVIIELESYELVSIWFGAGAIAALILFFLEFELIWQVGAFGFVSMFSLLFIRKAIKVKSKSEIATNIDAFAGLKVRVVKDFNEDGIGEVKLEGKIWTSLSQENQRFKENDLVTVVKVEGNKIIVKE